MARDFDLTNRLRTEGTRHLLSAAAATGVRRIIAQGLAYAYDPGGDRPANEDQPLWQHPPGQFAPVLRALIELEQRTRDAGGLVLRLGHLYGPRTIYAPDGSFVEQVRAGKVPLVGGGTSVFSFTHTYDAATAVLAALDADATGVLNIVDDDPATVATWLPVLATMLAAPQPRRVPSALARLAVGGWGVAFMTQLRGADNARARRTLAWSPHHRSWRDGFAHELLCVPRRRPDGGRRHDHGNRPGQGILDHDCQLRRSDDHEHGRRDRRRRTDRPATRRRPGHGRRRHHRPGKAPRESPTSPGPSRCTRAPSRCWTPAVSPTR